MPSSIRGKPGSKPQRERLRRELQADGCGTRQIVDEMVRRWHFRPRLAWRFAHGLTQDEAAERCNALIGSEGAPLTGKRISEYELWPMGGSRPSPRILALLGRVYAVRPLELTDHLDRKHLAAADIDLLRERGDLDQSEIQGMSSVPSRSDWAGGGSRVATARRTNAAAGNHSGNVEEAVIMSAAQESSDHAGQAETTNVGTATLETLRDDVTRLSRGLVHLDPLPLFQEMVSTRDRIYRILEGHQRPDQTRDLYFLVSVVCCLLADASQMFGHRAAALQQTRSAWAYAEIIGHDSIRAWCRSAQSFYAYRDKRPETAARLAASGQRFAGQNEASKQRLYSMEANALAAVGDKEGALRVFRLADEARERISRPDDFFDEMGGVFTADAAKHLHNTASGMISLGLATEAADAARGAIDLYEQSPESQRDISLEAGARITLATSHLLRSDIDGAKAELRPVFDIPPSLRSEPVQARLREFAQSLRTPALHSASQAVDLREQIDEFHVPSLPGATY
ncbi:hypothetical protein [Streptomyces marispadix]|uniref:XRE family transcriptional regulator n=1 Tax=Streptomyces marispadix TaxID=2922868 RepID=A0ABS9SZH8_9ACTN|nr:hypothetical protein [Streptomyces marispadix]MCH6161680.1 hypothetical protein [Streptomyces marispadix]